MRVPAAGPIREDEPRIRCPRCNADRGVLRVPPAWAAGHPPFAVLPRTVREPDATYRVLSRTRRAGRRRVDQRQAASILGFDQDTRERDPDSIAEEMGLDSPLGVLVEIVTDGYAVAYEPRFVIACDCGRRFVVTQREPPMLHPSRPRVRAVAFDQDA